MEIVSWEILSKLTPWCVLEFYFNSLKDDTENIVPMKDDVQKFLNFVQRNEQYNQSISKFIASNLVDTDSSKKSDFFRNNAAIKYENEDYLEGLEDINKAIEYDVNNPKNYLIRAYIFTRLSSAQIIPGINGSIITKYLNQAYDQGMADYRKVASLTKENDKELFFEAETQRISLQTGKVFLMNVTREERTKKLSELKNELNNLDKSLPYNDAMIGIYSKEIDNLIDYLKTSPRICSTNSDGSLSCVE